MPQRSTYGTGAAADANGNAVRPSGKREVVCTTEPNETQHVLGKQGSQEIDYNTTNGSAAALMMTEENSSGAQ